MRFNKSKSLITVETVKEAVHYSLSRGCSDDEAEEILDFYRSNSGASLDEIIADYFACE